MKTRINSKTTASRAAGWMLLAVVGFSLNPLIIWFGVQDMSPFMFVAVWFTARAVFHVLFRQARGRTDEKKSLRRTTLRQQLLPSSKKLDPKVSRSRTRLVILSDLAAIKPGYFWLRVPLTANRLLFALAVTLIDPVIATVLYGSWPVVFGFLALTPIWQKRMLDGKQGTKGGLSKMLAMLCIGSIAVSLAVFSEVSSLSWSSVSLWGALLAVLGSINVAVGTALSQMMGYDRSSSKNSSEETRDADISASGDSAASLLAAPVIAWLGTALWGSAELWTLMGFMLAVIAGLNLMFTAWCFDHANHLSREAHGQEGAQINTFNFLIDVGALLLLALFADTSIARPDLLIVGAAGVVVVNMVLHLDPEGTQERSNRSGGHGYTALALALWAAGALVLFRDDWLPDSWQVWSVVEYWGMIGICATVFTLILSFRQSRLAGRQREMDALMLRLHQKVVIMGRCTELTESDSEIAANLLREIDEARDPSALRESYLELRKLLVTRMEPQVDREQAKRLSDLLADAEVLVNLRQQGRNYSELAVLYLFSLLTVVMAVTARPANDMVPFASWVHDTTSLVIAAAFTFLGFDLIDKRQEADAPTMRKVSPRSQAQGQPRGWRLQLVTYRDRKLDRIVASLLGFVLLVGAVTMLGFKWM